MTVDDFLCSAEVAAPAIAAEGEPVGRRILGAVEATRAAVGQNTNLGILLLCAPLALAAERAAGPAALWPALEEVLAGLTVDDARLAYRAIRLASPGGLGRSDAADVQDEPAITLLEAMRLAADARPHRLAVRQRLRRHVATPACRRSRRRPPTAAGAGT